MKRTIYNYNTSNTLLKRVGTQNSNHFVTDFTKYLIDVGKIDKFLSLSEAFKFKVIKRENLISTYKEIKSQIQKSLESSSLNGEEIRDLVSSLMYISHHIELHRNLENKQARYVMKVGCSRNDHQNYNKVEIYIINELQIDKDNPQLVPEIAIQAKFVLEKNSVQFNGQEEYPPLFITNKLIKIDDEIRNFVNIETLRRRLHGSLPGANRKQLITNYIHALRGIFGKETTPLISKKSRTINLTDQISFKIKKDDINTIVNKIKLFENELKKKYICKGKHSSNTNINILLKLSGTAFNNRDQNFNSIKANNPDVTFTAIDPEIMKTKGSILGKKRAEAEITGLDPNLYIDIRTNEFSNLKSLGNSSDGTDNIIDKFRKVIELRKAENSFQELLSRALDVAIGTLNVDSAIVKQLVENPTLKNLNGLEKNTKRKVLLKILAEGKGPILASTMKKKLAMGFSIISMITFRRLNKFNGDIKDKILRTILIECFINIRDELKIRVKDWPSYKRDSLTGNSIEDLIEDVVFKGTDLDDKQQITVKQLYDIYEHDTTKTDDTPLAILNSQIAKNYIDRVAENKNNAGCTLTNFCIELDMSKLVDLIDQRKIDINQTTIEAFQILQNKGDYAEAIEEINKRVIISKKNTMTKEKADQMKLQLGLYEAMRVADLTSNTEVSLALEERLIHMTFNNPISGGLVGDKSNFFSPAKSLSAPIEIYWTIGLKI